MKFIIAAMIILSPFLTFGQVDSLQQYDSLGKYSYLLLGVLPDPTQPPIFPPRGNLPIVGNSTGFFVRSDGRLLLVSAFHVFSGCDVYRGVYEDLRAQYLTVWYTDSLGHYKYQILDLAPYMSKPCKIFLEIADVDTMDVSDYFKDAAKIYSIENFLPMNSRKNKTVDENKFISYGFPDDKFSEYIYKNRNLPKAPFGYIGKHADSSNYDPFYLTHNVDSMYTPITPGLIPGASGSPIFKVVVGRKKKEIIQFTGVQSGTSFVYNCSLFVKATELLKLLN